MDRTNEYSLAKTTPLIYANYCTGMTCEVSCGSSDEREVEKGGFGWEICEN